jgi:hypothetical protein
MRLDHTMPEILEQLRPLQQRFDAGTMAGGVAAGTKMPLHSPTSMPATPASAMVGTSGRPLRRKLEAEFRKLMQLADVKEKFKAMATPTVGGSAADFARTIEVETKMWGGVGRLAEVKLE